jgi:hypothetical protein
MSSPGLGRCYERVPSPRANCSPCSERSLAPAQVRARSGRQPCAQLNTSLPPPGGSISPPRGVRAAGTGPSAGKAFRRRRLDRCTSLKRSA